MSRDSTDCPGERSSIQGRVKPKTKKMVCNATLLNTQYYKVRVEPGEKSHAIPYTSVLKKIADLLINLQIKQ